MIKTLLTLAFALTLTACGGGGSSAAVEIVACHPDEQECEQLYAAKYPHLFENVHVGTYYYTDTTDALVVAEFADVHVGRLEMIR